MDIRHRICHISYKNADFESIFTRKNLLYCYRMCAKVSSTCKIILIFSCILSSVLWDNFLWMTLYHIYFLLSFILQIQNFSILCYSLCSLCTNMTYVIQCPLTKNFIPISSASERTKQAVRSNSGSSARISITFIPQR